MNDLERALPRDLVERGNLCGNEFVFPFDAAFRVIGFATKHQIAILGLEAFEVQKDGLLTVDLADASRYVSFTGDWNAYVVAMNAEAARWIEEHRLGEKHGYILSSASENEFASLK